MNSIDSKIGQFIRSNPELKTYKEEEIGLNDTNCTFLSEFIEYCWKVNYEENETRIKFSPAFLQWIAPQDKAIILRNEENTISACAVKHVMSFKATQKCEQICIFTALSVDPEHRGKRLAQYMKLLCQKHSIDQQYLSMMVWLDSRHSSPGSSFDIFGKKDRLKQKMKLKLYGKSFDITRVQKYEKLNPAIKAAAYVLQKSNPSKKGNSFSDGMSFKEYDESIVQEIAAFLNNLYTESRIRRHYSTEELHHKFGFRKDGFSPFSFFLADPYSKIRATMFGFPIKIQRDDYFANIDGLYFDKRLEVSERRKFISECEGVLIDKYRCIAAAYPETVSNCGVLYGYMPYGNQMLGVDCFTDLKLKKKDIGALMLEIR